MRFILSFDDFLKKLSVLDFVPLFLIRVYLFFVFWFAGVDKIENLEKELMNLISTGKKRLLYIVEVVVEVIRLAKY